MKYFSKTMPIQSNFSSKIPHTHIHIKAWYENTRSTRTHILLRDKRIVFLNFVEFFIFIYHGCIGYIYSFHNVLPLIFFFLIFLILLFSNFFYLFWVYYLRNTSEEKRRIKKNYIFFPLFIIRFSSFIFLY